MGLWSQNPPCLASELAVSRRVAAQTVVHFGEDWRKWAVLGEVDCALGTWGAEVSSVEGVSVDVVVFEVRPNPQVRGELRP